MTNEDDKTDDSGARKRFSDADFAAARELYELGKAGIAELAEDFGVSRQTLSKRLKDAGSVRGSRAHELTQAAGAAAKAVAERFTEGRAQWIEETRIEGLKSLKQVRMIGQKILVEEVRRSSGTGGPTSLAGVDDDLRALGRMNKILIENLGAALNILKADEHVDDDDLPTLTVADLTDTDILNHHIATGVLPEDATVEDLNSEDLA